MRPAKFADSVKVEYAEAVVPDPADPGSGCVDGDHGEHDTLRWIEWGDSREWNGVQLSMPWPRQWSEPVVLVHYPPREGRWFWLRAVGLRVRCPVGSIMLVPRPLTGDEVEEIIQNYGRLHNAYLAYAFDCYQSLRVCVVRENGGIELRGEVTIPASDGEWEGHMPPAVAARVNAMVDEILADPGWQELCRRPKPVTCQVGAPQEEPGTGDDQPRDADEAPVLGDQNE